MADISVKQFSQTIGYDLDNLLGQMSAAGLPHKSGDDVVSVEDKKVLLSFIKESKKNKKETISLKGKAKQSKISVKRINSPQESSVSSSKSKDLKGAIDFDEAERKRVSAQNEAKHETNDSKTKIVRKSKKD